MHLHISGHDLLKAKDTVGLDGLPVGFLDGPERVVVIVHGEACDRLVSASSGIGDVMGMKAV